MDIQEELERLGMSPKKVTAYLTLLQTTGCTVTELSALSEIKRTTCLHILSQLVEEKLVSESRRGRWVVYTANDPKMILEETEKRERLARRVLPELKEKEWESGRAVSGCMTKILPILTVCERMKGIFDA